MEQRLKRQMRYFHMSALNLYRIASYAISNGHLHLLTGKVERRKYLILRAGPLIAGHLLALSNENQWQRPEGPRDLSSVRNRLAR
jgi:hypothetical protein